MRLNILVLHALGDIARVRKTSIDHALCYRRYAPAHNYLYHDINMPVTEALCEIRFHAVILDTTALCIRYYRPRELFEAGKERYRFLAQSDAVRVALPQDEYDHSDILDQWLDEYRIDVVYSVLWKYRHLLYSRTSRRAEILPSLTGYVNDEDVTRVDSFSRPFHQREIDVGYRVRRLPAQFGSFGQQKGRLADMFGGAAVGRGLILDVSTRAEDVFVGDDWLRFLGNCRWTLGAESGSSLWDPDGTIADRVAAFVAEQPHATFEEIEAACFPGRDRQYVFSAISPRVFEAALAGCGQLLLEGEYLGVLRPGEHYLSLGEQGERIEDVFREMQDAAAAERMVRHCHQALIESSEFRYSQHVQRVITQIEKLVAAKHVEGSSQRVFERLVQWHRKLVERQSRVLHRVARGDVWALMVWVWEKIPIRFRQRIPEDVRRRVRTSVRGW